jgi:hypothetical protein
MEPGLVSSKSPAETVVESGASAPFHLHSAVGMRDGGTRIHCQRRRREVRITITQETKLREANTHIARKISELFSEDVRGREPDRLFPISRCHSHESNSGPGAMTWLRSLVDSGMLGKHVLMMKTRRSIVEFDPIWISEIV